MRQPKSIFSLMAAMFLLLSACMGCTGRKAAGGTYKSVYYWHTTFSIDSTKRAFITDHGIEKLYVRYFDVVPAGNFPQPNATIRIDSLPADLNVEIAPVVFILPDALDCDRRLLAEMILKRVRQMSRTHGLGEVREVQIDCDWTPSTRQPFFDFMRLLKERTDTAGITLTSTIRLHQLATAPPPAHRGVLMVYNTGDFTDINKEKPILDPEDVAPYLKHLEDYPLPLVSAYPIYKWDMLFRNGRFVDFIHSEDDVPVLEGDTVVSRFASAEDILMCRRAIEKERPDCADEIILFDLNNYNINRYDKPTFESFYNNIPAL